MVSRQRQLAQPCQATAYDAAACPSRRPTPRLRASSATSRPMSRRAPARLGEHRAAEQRRHPRARGLAGRTPDRQRLAALVECLGDPGLLPVLGAGRAAQQGQPDRVDLLDVLGHPGVLVEVVVRRRPDDAQRSLAGERVPELRLLQLDRARGAQRRDVVGVGGRGCGHVHAVLAPRDVPALVVAEPSVRMRDGDLAPEPVLGDAEQVAPERLDLPASLRAHAAEATESRRNHWKSGHSRRNNRVNARRGHCDEGHQYLACSA